jgi:hypothetical protein
MIVATAHPADPLFHFCRQLPVLPLAAEAGSEQR